jgi:hypothetical protein
MIAYVHPGLLANREADESVYESIVWHVSSAPPLTDKQGKMVLTLERAGPIRWTPGIARSIEILVEPEDLPVLR